MIRLAYLLIVLMCLSSCNEEVKFTPRSFSNVEINTLVEDSLLNVRAIEIPKEDGCVFATSDGRLGTIMNIGAHRDYAKGDSYLTDYSIELNHEDVNLNFRSLALIPEKVFTLSIASPALLYKNDVLVYKEDHEKAFYDAMDFWNDKEGIAIGDPTEDCMSIIITRDGGESWTKLSCDALPKAKEGEAAFAASDTNIAIVGDHTWVATGGMSSRILYSSDRGHTWEVYDTPIIQGKQTTGMYSIDFYDEYHGFAIGGDYTKPNDSISNKIRTSDGGKTWQVVADAKGPGYRSCVQYIPGREGKELVAIGFKGIDYSSDAGDTWTHLSDEGFYTIRFLNDSTAYAAGRGRISKLTFRE